LVTILRIELRNNRCDWFNPKSEMMTGLPNALVSQFGFAGTPYCKADRSFRWPWRPLAYWYRIQPASTGIVRRYQWGNLHIGGPIIYFQAFQVYGYAEIT
jgi:hypothetical protein